MIVSENSPMKARYRRRSVLVVAVARTCARHLNAALVVRGTPDSIMRDQQFSIVLRALRAGPRRLARGKEAWWLRGGPGHRPGVRISSRCSPWRPSEPGDAAAGVVPCAGDDVGDPSLLRQTWRPSQWLSRYGRRRSSARCGTEWLMLVPVVAYGSEWAVSSRCRCGLRAASLADGATAAARRGGRHPATAQQGQVVHMITRSFKPLRQRWA